MAEFSNQYSHSYDYRDCREYLDPVLKGRCYRGLSRSLKQWGVPICLHPSIYTNVDMLNICVYLCTYGSVDFNLESYDNRGILPDQGRRRQAHEAGPGYVLWLLMWFNH